MVVYKAEFFSFMHERSIDRHAIVRVRSFSDLVNCIYPSDHTQETMIFLQSTEIICL
jgi:hypothetical protein